MSNESSSFSIDIPSTFTVPVRGINVLLGSKVSGVFDVAIAYRVAPHQNVVEVETSTSTPFFSICQNCEYRKNFLNPYAPDQISCPGGYHAIQNYITYDRSRNFINRLNDSTILDPYQLTPEERGYVINKNAPICLKGSSIGKEQVPNLRDRINYVATFPDYYFVVSMTAYDRNWEINEQYVLACPSENEIKTEDDLRSVTPFVSTNVYLADGRICNGSTTSGLDYQVKSQKNYDFSNRLYRFLAMQRNNDLSEVWRDLITANVTQHDIFKWISDGVYFPSNNQSGPFAGQFLKGAELLRAIYFLKKYRNGSPLWRSESIKWQDINTFIGSKNYKSHFIPIMPDLESIKVSYDLLTLSFKNGKILTIPTEYSDANG